MAMYSVKEIFYSLQGEGARAGRPAVFCRFAGCNLWSGREQDRATAQCTFCDTDFVGVDGLGGGKFKTAEALATTIAGYWPALNSADSNSKNSRHKPYVVCTGGEPLLQLDTDLIDALHARGFEVAVETNGTLPAPAGIDWLCVSPKGQNALAITRGDELKLVHPQTDISPEQVAALDFAYFYLQPMDDERGEHNTRVTLQYCLDHPQWSLSLQTHKTLNIR